MLQYSGVQKEDAKEVGSHEASKFENHYRIKELSEDPARPQDISVPVFYCRRPARWGEYHLVLNKNEYKLLGLSY